MSRTTLRIVIILACLSIAGLTITQLYWVRRAFDLRVNQFNRDVNTALRTVADKIFLINETPSPYNNPVDQISTNYFVVHVNGTIDNRLLSFLLKTEFEKRNISTPYEYCVYDCIDKCIANGNTNIIQKPLARLKAQDGYYFAVQFTKLEATLISQLGIWGFSTAVLMVVIAFFAYTLFVILKQRRLSEVQKDFINNMTHEFKTPLSTIAISAAVLKDPQIIHDPERLFNYSTIIENENKRLRQHVDQVLQVARLDQKDIGLKKEILDIHNVIIGVTENLMLPLQEKNGNFTLALNAAASTVNADALHITNVLFNLLDNAIKYTLQQPEIRISTVNIANKISIEITDNGKGISASDQKKVFDRFYRVSTGNVHDVKGFGLGLNYVKLMVEAHGGRVSLRSTPGKGSSFTIILPQA